MASGVSGAPNGGAQLRRPLRPLRISEFYAHESAISSCCLSANAVLATAGEDNRVHTWRIGKKEPVRTFQLQNSTVMDSLIFDAKETVREPPLTVD
jgi:WD40 repeat protein